MTQQSPEQTAGRNPRWIWLAVVAIFVAGLVAALYWQRPAPRGGFPGEVSVARAAAMRGQGSFLLDVRQPQEWTEAHVPGSTLIPLGELEARIAEVPRGREIVVVCRSGNRSRRGRDILREAGFEEVTSMAGGLTAWKMEGHPTISGP